ncbi:hypothetical protein [Colwellia sp. Bg11-28]|uniref:hypothetical protein n=1 Tax=Colwellia sp. Bg11-28 TaxID=2058305 RepID=UPI000C31EE7A|nr:hypothetical protein [Colwellia sp. Bg11-28]PKH86879.1 hypothetical protein CXF79_09085 [Colwellia sp. Bg11-28]
MDLDKESIAKGSYRSLCSNEEIERIFNVSSASDFLLKVRADTAIDHMRIYRVFRHKMIKAGNNWNFSNYFDVKPFESYIKHLADDEYTQAQELTAGFVFCENPNGSIEKTDFGNIITVSESLRYFLYFMNIAFLDFDNMEVPIEVKGAAIKIAIRTMLQSEAVDFDMDPRGKVPEEIHDAAKYHTDRQLEFIIGHEFAHHFLGHLDNANLIEGKYLSAINSDDITHKFFSYAQKEELDADINAIERPMYTPDMKVDLINRALFFFVYLDIYESVKEQIMPSMGHIKSHPNPIDRFKHLHNHFKNEVEFDSENLDNLLKWSEKYKESLSEDVALNIESYESYGSMYLAQWRGKVLVDRVDY